MIIKYKNMYYKCNPTKIDNVNDVETDFDKVIQDEINNWAWCIFLVLLLFFSIIFNIILATT